MIGSTISHYKILEKLGEGGMGVVYKAQDTTLNRTVALKFLPEHISSSEADTARFMQEAQAAASLNHPNICTIHGIEEADGKNFIVMEYVDGQTLQERKSTLSMKQALEIGIQISEGLAAAHEKGIVHRDIKPENIMIHKDGRAQIMDFGLAKLRGASRLTKEGSTVGTAGYMSPEQIQGLDADSRSDIFSLGVLLYEMLTGQLPFKGVHETAIAYEIVNVDPPFMSTVKQEISPDLDQMAAECMAKDPSDRYQSAAEVARNLRRFRKDSGSKTSRASRISDLRRPSRRPLVTPERIIWGVVVLLLSAFFVVMLPPQQKDTSPVIRFTILPPENTTINQLALSPRGTYLAFAATGNGKTLLWIRRMDETSSHSLEGTEGAAFPFWSPDEQYIGFFANGRLKKTGISRGTPVIICDAPDGRGASWNESGTIIFAPFANDVLYRVSAGGGTPQAVTKLDTSAHDQEHIWPVFFPDGEQFLYSSRRFNDDRSAIHVASLSTHQDKTLLVSDGNASLALPAYILFVREGTLMAQKIDFARAELSGSPSPLAENVSQVPLFGVGSYSVSLNGVLAIGGGRSTSRQYTWFDRHGKRLGTVGPPGNYFDINVSPDEKRAAIQFNDIQSKNSDIWIIDLLSGAMSRFTFEETFEDNPVWSPDGESIAYCSITDTGSVMFKKASSGKGTAERLEGDGSPYSWSPDGQYLFYNEGHSVGDVSGMLLPMKGRSQPSLYSRNAQEPQFSPDGKWIAFASNESGRFEVYVQTFPASGGKWQISTNGGAQPRWNPNGKELFFVSAEKILMSANVQTGTTFRNGIPVPLFETKIDNYESPNRYVVVDHGQRFLMNVQEEGAPVNPVTIVVNWTKDVDNH